MRSNGETGMGYTCGVFHFIDGRRLPWAAEVGMIFPDLPDGYDVDQITGIDLHSKESDDHPFVKTMPFHRIVFRDYD